MAGKMGKDKINPLQLKWLHSPIKILGIYVLYDENGNKQMNVNLILQNMQANLDIWRARDLTLFGRVQNPCVYHNSFIQPHISMFL